MLARRAAFEASARLCCSCRRLYRPQIIKHASLPIFLNQRRLSATPPSSGLCGLWELLKTDRHMKYIDREIGKILEDYDNALDLYYARAQEYVFFPMGLQSSRI